MDTNQLEQIGRYRLIERVGRGAMGVLYRGVDPVLDREVAIKLMLLDFSEDKEQMRARFFREARAIAKLQHRNIVTVFEFAEENNTPYIVMEFLNGTSLASRIASPRPLSLDEKLSIAIQLCDALNYAHQQGVVHRDVKPANVFLMSDGSVKLLDFGIAKLQSSTLTRTAEVFGSVAYMSPEQVASSNVDGRADIFSAGVVLYELLARRKPFESPHATATIMKILHEPPPPLDDVSGLPRPLLAIVSKALEKKLENRYQTAGELAEALEAVRRTLGTKIEDEPVAASRLENEEELRKYQELVSAPTIQESQGPMVSPTAFASPTRFQPAPSEAAAPSGFEPTRPLSAPSEAPVVAESARPQWAIPAGIAAVLVIGIIAVFMMRGGPSRETPPPATTPAAGAAAPSPTPAAAPAAPTAATPSAPVAAPTVAKSAPASGREPAASESPRPSSRPRPASESEPVAAAPAPTKSSGGGTVAVSIRSTYPVEVFAGSRSVSAAAEAHDLTVDAGTTVRVRAPQYMLDAALKAEGRTLEYQAPAIGYLTVLTKYETCNVKVGERDLGYPPITKQAIASGQHRVDISCANGPNPPGQLVTVAPNTIATVRIY